MILVKLLFHHPSEKGAYPFKNLILVSVTDLYLTVIMISGCYAMETPKGIMIVIKL